ncbi:MAG: EAL domain-containing protein [Candidatus Hodarchaeales archaeon]|jgi:EAL domain-containing protein (putative c-di-GMP-specific phosphodiesterase class I)
MTNHSTNEDLIVPSSIQEHFYFNKHLGLPTLIKKYDVIENQLFKSQYLACITIKFDDLNKIEHQYGSNVYLDILFRITETLKDVKKQTLRSKDIFVLDLYDVDTFIIFLSSPRDKNTQLFYHLESIAERFRSQLDEKLFNLLYPYLKQYSKSIIGYALEIYNPMVSKLRMIMQLVGNAKKMGEFISIRRKFSIRYAIQKIIIEQNLYTLFQPIVNLQKLEVLGYEALSRGPRGTEFHNPLLLFNTAMECGLAFELDRICRKKALVSARNLKTDKKIFVNTLSMTIHDTEFRGIYLKELLKDLEIKPENVIFEVSEKLAIDNYSLFRESMKDYTDLGIVHAGDDLGTGYSDLERIMELRPGYLKLDISFTHEIHKSYIKQEIVKAIVTLANKIGSKIVAEGIETKEEYEKILELGIVYGQGYLFGKPSETIAAINKDF